MSFCVHDSGYQSDALNCIGVQFKRWSRDKERTSVFTQMLEIAEQLDDNGKWFIQTLCDYMGDRVERTAPIIIEEHLY